MTEPFREPHTIPINHSRAMPRGAIFVDTESVEESLTGLEGVRSQRFRLGCAICCRFRRGETTAVERLRFATPHEFWTWAQGFARKGEVTWIFAHSAGYDLALLNFWSYLEAATFVLQEPDGYVSDKPGELLSRKKGWRGICILDEPPTIISWRCAGKTFRAVDTLNYWPVPLAQLGASVGIAKQQWPGFDSDDETLADYCMNDVTIIWRAVSDLVRYWRGQDLGTFRPTASGLSWSAYRHRFMGEPIHIHGDRDAIELERASYYGGRVHCHYVGPVAESFMAAEKLEAECGRAPETIPLGPIYVLDMQSAYPYVMAGEKYPVELEWSRTEATVADLGALQLDQSAIACIDLDAGRPFPIRQEDGSIAYATGHFCTSLAGSELMSAYRGGMIRRIHRLAIYRVAPIFADFVAHFYALKMAAERQGDGARRLFAKMVLNSLYGRFAQRSPRWDLTGEPEHDPPWDHWIRANVDSGSVELLRSIAGAVQRKGERGEHKDSFPAIAAFATAALRVRMSELEEIAGRGNVFYSDTDSLHVNYVGRDRLVCAGIVTPGRLGHLRDVGTYSEGHYYGCKHYTLDGVLVCAGVSSRAQITADGSIVTRRFERSKSIISRRPDGTVRVSEQSQNVPVRSPGGSVGPDGWVTPPIL